MRFILCQIMMNFDGTILPIVCKQLMNLSGRKLHHLSKSKHCPSFLYHSQSGCLLTNQNSFIHTSRIIQRCRSRCSFDCQFKVPLHHFHMFNHSSCFFLINIVPTCQHSYQMSQPMKHSILSCHITIKIPNIFNFMSKQTPKHLMLPSQINHKKLNFFLSSQPPECSVLLPN